MTVYEFLKQNQELLKKGCKCGIISTSFLYHIEIIEYYYMRLERGRKGTNPKTETIEKFNISPRTFYYIKNKMSSLV